MTVRPPEADGRCPLDEVESPQRAAGREANPFEGADKALSHEAIRVEEKCAHTGAIRLASRALAVKAAGGEGSEHGGLGNEHEQVLGQVDPDNAQRADTRRKIALIAAERSKERSPLPPKSSFRILLRTPQAPSNHLLPTQDGSPRHRAARRPQRRGRGEGVQVRAGAQLRHPGRERDVVVDGQRRSAGCARHQVAHHHPDVERRRRVLRRQGHRQQEPERLGPGRHCGRVPRARDGQALQRARDPALGPLRQEAAAVVRRHAGGGREVLRGARRAPVELAHAGPVGGADGGERGHQQEVLRAHGQDGPDPGGGAGPDRRRGGRRGQQRRGQRVAVLAAGGHPAGVQRAGRGVAVLHDRRGVRQRARRVQAGQREAAPGDPGRLPEVRGQGEGSGGGEAGVLRVPRRLGLDGAGDPDGRGQRCGEDEHRHGHAVGVLERPARVLRGQEGLPAGPDRQPRGPGCPEQEVLRPACVGAQVGGVDDRSSAPGVPQPELRERAVSVAQPNKSSSRKGGPPKRRCFFRMQQCWQAMVAPQWVVVVEEVKGEGQGAQASCRLVLALPTWQGKRSQSRGASPLAAGREHHGCRVERERPRHGHSILSARGPLNMSVRCVGSLGAGLAAHPERPASLTQWCSSRGERGHGRHGMAPWRSPLSRPPVTMAIFLACSLVLEDVDEGSKN
ncbi:hypothetical protein ON010_g5636 [Phytophthora cinnamomi]|nr:hypothetical protein ON010_g5636 [Phytophthora cinnamomi]